MKYIRACLAAAAVALAGCSVTSDSNPYLYRYSTDRGDNELCLVNETPEGNDALVMAVRGEVEEKGFRVREVSREEARSCRRCVHFVLVSVESRQGGPRLEKAALTLTQQRRNYLYSFTVTDTFAEVGLISMVNDNTRIVRQLVDRIFPDPAPWQEE